MRLVFMGTPEFAVTCLRRILTTEHRVVCVVTQPDRPAGRGHKLQPSPVKAFAQERGLTVLAPNRPVEPAFVTRLRELEPDLAVVVAYGRILPRSVIDIPRLGCINAHASVLPQLRGAAPIERSILEGFDSTGVTIMRINERMDAGDTMISRAMPIEPDMDGGTLREHLADLAADLLVESISALERGCAVFTPQDESLATYAPPLRKEEARIDWSRPAEIVARQIRAFAPRPGAFTTDGSRRLKLFRGEPIPEKSSAAPGFILETRGDAMVVACVDSVLLVRTVQPEGRRAMPAAAYLRGCDEKLPRRLGSETDGPPAR